MITVAGRPEPDGLASARSVRRQHPVERTQLCQLSGSTRRFIREVDIFAAGNGDEQALDDRPRVRQLLRRIDDAEHLGLEGLPWGPGDPQDRRPCGPDGCRRIGACACYRDEEEYEQTRRQGD